MSAFSLPGFAAFLAAVARATDEHLALHEAAMIVETEAKRVIGTYDYDWPVLAERTQQDRAAQGFAPNEPGLRTGEMRDSIEHTVLPGEAQVGSDNDKLVWFDQGTSRQPPRSVLMGAAVHTEEKVVERIGRTMTARLTGDSGAIAPPGAVPGLEN